ncbi:hypothetical protein BABINDRAFT_159467 [Babjeviella inositovora NRRL Y-12698]|uniref:Signal recognition particle receptor subunit beta n=1 Tax=Babjeviella inositovora NRRL Y-12698 TaxID=984486 RepID=A0A1E3QZC8_9ASCO|nr:uncharacterized protein BABINDRAFT_159467 [Babjeviella inositovora NRRL Y-12698]ODQ82988.1 hypothetical protein BABINDRAFT_159467 [Babjeviella inositovora NRRL Y-12698]
MELSSIVIFTLVLGIIATALVYLSQTFSLKSLTTKAGKPNFLVLGPNNGGKTTLTQRLVEHSLAAVNLDSQSEEDATALKDQQPTKFQTVMTTEPQTYKVPFPIAGTSGMKKQVFNVIDYPGHVSQKNLLLASLRKTLLPTIKGVVVVIDSTWSKAELEQLCANYLIPCLQITESKFGGVNYLFAVNKTDLFNSQSVLKLKTTLEAEINNLLKLAAQNVNTIAENETKSAIEDDDATGITGFHLAAAGSFTFDQLDGNMDFLGGSALNGETFKWEDWMDERVMNPI